MERDDVYMGCEQHFGPLDPQDSLESYDIWTEYLSSSSERNRREALSLMLLEDPSQAMNLMTTEKQLLDQFKNKQKRKPPKKEYIRCKLIRGHKRANRQISQKVIPARALNRFERTNQRSMMLWKRMIEVYESNKAEIDQVSPTEAGPLTDGKKRRVVDKDAQKSFNDNFCKEYFSSPAIRESYCYYIELLFSDFDLDILCEKFKIFCCSDGHVFRCIGKWQNLKFYMQFDIVLSVHILPYGYPIPAHSKPQNRQDDRMEEDSFLSELSL